MELVHVFFEPNQSYLYSTLLARTFYDSTLSGRTFQGLVLSYRTISWFCTCCKTKKAPQYSTFFSAESQWQESLKRQFFFFLLLFHVCFARMKIFLSLPLSVHLNYMLKRHILHNHVMLEEFEAHLALMYALSSCHNMS